MAGIGFRLRDIKQSGSIESIFRAYGFAGLISSGPWIVSILSLIILTAALRGIIHTDQDAIITLFSSSEIGRAHV